MRKRRYGKRRSTRRTYSSRRRSTRRVRRLRPGKIGFRL